MLNSNNSSRAIWNNWSYGFIKKKNQERRKKSMSQSTTIIIYMILIACIPISGILILFFAMAIATDTPQSGIDKLKDSIPADDNPSKDSLLRIVNHKKFKKLSANLQNAVKEKLKCYSHAPTPIEATMTLAQLVDIESPLWTVNIKIELVSECYELQRLINSVQTRQGKPKLTNLGTYIQEYVLDRQQGISQLRAQEKQLDKIEKEETNETTIKN